MAAIGCHSISPSRAKYLRPSWDIKGLPGCHSPSVCIRDALIVNDMRDAQYSANDDCASIAEGIPEQLAEELVLQRLHAPSRVSLIAAMETSHMRTVKGL